MKTLCAFLNITVLFILTYSFGFAQKQDTIIISPKVGAVIDSAEKKQYRIFPYYPDKSFISAVFIKKSDSIMILRANFKEDSTVERKIFMKELEWMRSIIDGNIPNNINMGNSKRNIPKPFVINFGLGGSNVGISIGGDVSFIRAEKQFSIRYLHNFEAGYFLFLHDEFPVENVMDVGILYGWRKQVKAVSFSIAGGISIVRGIERGDFLNSCTECFFYQGYYEPVKYTTIGIPLDCHFIYHPNSWFIGYGLSGFGNLNLKKSFSGILFSLQFGDLT